MDNQHPLEAHPDDHTCIEVCRRLADEERAKAAAMEREAEAALRGLRDGALWGLGVIQFFAVVWLLYELTRTLSIPTIDSDQWQDWRGWSFIGAFLGGLIGFIHACDADG